jgi:hypothetical protein
VLSLEKEITPTPAGKRSVAEGDRIEMPIAPRGLERGKTVRGIVNRIDVVWRRRRYAGLVLVSDEDGAYYEIVPGLVRHLATSSTSRKRAA